MNYSAYLAITKLSNILISKPAIITYIALIVISIVTIMIFLLFKDSDKNGEEIKIVGNINVPATSPSKEEEEERRERFCMLSEIERKKDSYGHRRYEKDVTLESFCNDFR
ncbi:MAG: hypothetical protein J6V42_04345, partial [Clostridia bacterium]|nr:hypothetical protein [Clostridia bacterium]